MLADAQMLDSKGEKLVTKMVEGCIANKGGKDLIVDQTNCNLKYMNQLVNFCRCFDVVQLKFFPISIEEAVDRDLNRVQIVGLSVIERMYKGYEEIVKAYPTEKHSLNKKTLTPEKVGATEVRPRTVIFDMDGTLALMEGIRGSFEWSKVGLDQINEDVKTALFLYWDLGFKVIIVSGRDGICRDETAEWLTLHNIEYHELFMRAPNDFRKDTVIKEEIYRNQIEPKYNVIGVFDDRDSVCKMWREIGLTCFQVAEGNF